MDKTLVVGVDTVCGANLALAWAERQEVVGVSLRQRVALEGVAVEQVAPEDQESIARLIDDFAPRHLVYAGALAAASWDLPKFDPTWQHVALVVRTLADWARAHDTQLTVVLSDAVFAGPRMFHDENASPSGSHPAAARLLAVEARLADSGALVVRTHAYGWAPAGTEPGLAEKIWRRLSAGTPPVLDGGRYATPILATDLAPLIDRAVAARMNGVLHVAGAERASPFRFAAELATAFGFSAPRRSTSVIEPTAETDEVAETSLSTRRARRTLEVPMPMLREGLQRFAAQLESKWHERSRQLDAAAPLHEQAA